MTERHVLCVGSLCLDTLVQLPPSGFPSLGSLAAASFIADFPGGGCGNSAIALARLGIKVTVAGKVGCDPEGDLIQGAMMRENITGTMMDPETPTGRSIVLLSGDGAERSFLYREGANERLRLDDLSPYFSNTYDALLITDPFLTNVGRFELTELLELARSLSVLTAVDFCWDPSGQWAAIYRNLWPLIDVAFANREEATMLTGKPDPRQAAVTLLDAGTGTAVIKLGPDGLVAADSEDIRTIPACDARAKDPTGAGDWCNAGVLARYLNGGSLFEAAITGCMAGAAAVAVLGGSEAIPSADLLRACTGDRTRS